MLQIKTFELPAQESAANEFLKTHKPMGELARMWASGSSASLKWR
jgi:hypothetical protein